jgi:hypothetical protein
MKASEKIWWTKLAGAIAAAIICLVVQVYFNVAGTTAFMLGVLIYVAMSDLLARRDGMDPMRGLKIGVGVYLFTWVALWTLLYTVIQTMG